MFSPGFLFPAFLFRSGADRKSSRRRKNLALESLEGRVVLSHAALHTAAHLAVGANVISLPHGPQLGPVVNHLGSGFAVKSPRFYAFFAGAKRAELNAGGARAFVDSTGNVNFVGILAGPLNTSPTDPSQEAWYTWGINRGTGTAIAPFAGRPNIKFDTLVVVGITQSGISGELVDLSNGTTITTLNPATISTPTAQGANNMVKVTLPVSAFLPPGAQPSSIPTVAFWASDAPPSTDSSHVASFAPEFRNFPIGFARGAITLNRRG